MTVPQNPYAKKKVGYGGSSKAPQTYFGKSRPSSAMFRSQHDRLSSRISDLSKMGGLRNIGNSCYMNAALQGIFALPTFVDCLLGEKLATYVEGMRSGRDGKVRSTNNDGEAMEPNGTRLHSDRSTHTIIFL